MLPAFPSASSFSDFIMPVAEKVAINTVDTAEFGPNFALYRVTKIKTDYSGVTIQLKTGEKIRSVSIFPRHQIKAMPANGVLCTESCQGGAPTILHIYRIKPVLFRTTGRRGDGGSMVNIVTNSNSVYKFDVVPGTPVKRTLLIGE
jgi:hypothetical protein